MCSSQQILESKVNHLLFFSVNSKQFLKLNIPAHDNAPPVGVVVVQSQQRSVQQGLPHCEAWKQVPTACHRLLRHIPLDTHDLRDENDRLLCILME